MRAGDPQRAIELLEKAMVLAGEDDEVVRQILQELAGACSAAGLYEQADRYRQRLEKFCQPSPALQPAGNSPIHLPMASKRRWPAVLGIILAILVLFAGTAIVTVVVMQGKVKPSQPASPALTPDQQSPSSPTDIRPADAGVVNQSPAAAAPASAPARIGRQELLKDTVGLVVVMLRYEGTAAGKLVRYDIPWSTGSAFAINTSGNMLTTKHVIDPISSTDIPPTLQSLGMPTLVLRERSLLICLGRDAKDRYVGKVIHQSAKYDLAVVKVARTFAAPLALASTPIKQMDTIYLCGYPAVVQEVWDQSAGANARMAQIEQKWRQSGQVQTIDTLSQGSFDSTLAKGAVIVPERNIDEVSYLQTDAAIGQGYCGGPAINELNEVVGILTTGVKDGPAGVPAKYTFAFLVDQCRYEIEKYTQSQ
jgi:S1-C subfamily serine protease